MTFQKLIFRDPETDPEDETETPTFDFDDPIIKGDRDIPDIR
jgi:hypothetical protein